MRDSLRAAALHPANLAILGAALAAGLLVALWLLPVGLLAYMALVVLTAREPRRPAPVPRVRAPRGTVFQAQLDGIDQAQREIGRSVAAAGGALRPALERVTAQVDGIVQEAYTLATKGQTIVTYLEGVNLQDLNAQLTRAEAQMRAATDPVVRQQYAETRDALADRLRNARALSAYRDRITAQLDNIHANLHNVLAETVRLRAAPAADSTLSTDSVSSRLSDVRADMDALGQMLDTALTGVT